MSIEADTHKGPFPDTRLRPRRRRRRMLVDFSFQIQPAPIATHPTRAATAVVERPVGSIFAWCSLFIMKIMRYYLYCGYGSTG
jgi:hypothetical protein